MRILPFSIFAVASMRVLVAAVPREATQFESSVKPLLREFCIDCHNAKKHKGDLNLEAFLIQSAQSALVERTTWTEVLSRMREGEMPPTEEKQPTPERVAAVVAWFDGEYAELDRHAAPNPGRVTVRRLNRYEYDNTVRDLLGVNFRVSEDFPADQFGYGFNNIGDVLTLSPLLMEKYLEAAERISRIAVPLSKPYPNLAMRYEAEASGQQRRAHIQAVHDFPVDGTYNLRTAWEQGLPNNFQMAVRTFVDGNEVLNLLFVHGSLMDRAREAKGVAIPRGTHKIETWIDVPPPAPGARPTAYPYPVRIEINGPFEQVPREQSASYRQIFQTEGVFATNAPAKSARQILVPLVRRAYRRPAARKDLNPLVGLVNSVQERGGSFEDGIRTALQAILISPNFLFRIERDPTGNAPHLISDLELASRLSYFLWSTMPDDELLAVAEKGRLGQPEVLHAQVRRMLADPKGRTLAENFAGQWLQTRNLESLKPDRNLFPDFDLPLRDDMMTETTLFFHAVVAEDRSILDFLDGKFTFLNERLAELYRIPDVQGREFRRVELDGTVRSGILTQASVLTVTSYPTRTSPVIRGKWVLENILNAPPRDPPANVPALDETDGGSAASIRLQLEKHRSQAECAGCHARMDPLGFGLENYDGIGRWRTAEGGLPVDATGRLPNGKAFSGSEELKAVFRADAPRFVRAFSEKLLTYALGRGLESYDKPAIEKIARRVEQHNHRFSELVAAIVDSVPFRMRHRENTESLRLDTKSDTSQETKPNKTP